MSDLFLDNEVRLSLPRMALTIVQLNASREEVDFLWRYQLAPLLHWNLKIVAGEWAYFDENWLEKRVKFLRFSVFYWLSFVPLVGRLLHWFRVGMIERDYRALWQFVALLQQTPEGEREARVNLWSRVTSLYVTPSGTPLFELSIGELKRHAFNPEEVNRVFIEELEPILRPTLLPSGGDMTPEQASDSWRVAMTALRKS